MTESGGNPFGEGFDMNALMQQAQAMQEQLMAAQDRLAHASVDGTAGGVTVTISGTGELTGVAIEQGRFSDDAESLQDLGDLVVAAYRDAKAQADSLAAEALGPMAGGFGGGDDTPQIGGGFGFGV